MDDNTIDVRGIVSLLRRQFRLILVTVILIVGVATAIAFALTPTYTASALILVDPSNKNLLDPETQMTSAVADSARIDSEVELVRSDNVLLKVIQSENLTADEEFGVSLGMSARLLAFFRIAQPTLPTGEEALNQTLTKLRTAVSVQRRGLTYLISVDVRSKDPAKSAHLTNTLTRLYIADQLDFKVNSMLASRDILQARIEQARDAIVRSEGSFDSFIEQNLARITRETGRPDLASMARQAEEIAAAREQSISVSGQVRASLQNQDWSSVVAGLQSDALTELERQRAELAMNLSGAAAGSPAEIDLRAELAGIEERLRQTAETELTSLERSVQSSQAQEDTLRQNLRREVLSSSLSGDVLTQIYELQQNAELARGQYQTLLARVQDVEAQADLQVADSRIVSPALSPQVPSFPNKLLIIALAALASLGVGVALAFLYENLIGGFTSEDQVASVLRTQIAATIPRERSKSEKDSLSNMIVTSPLSIFSESIRRVRAALENSLRANDRVSLRNGKVIMVTSTIPNEGKTTLAVSLARSYASSGKRTILIDCDLRKPSIHRHLNVEPGSGLLEFLTSELTEADITPVLTRDPLTSATFVIGSRRSDLPTDQLLAGPSFQRLLEAARLAFDVVILDTPPIGPVVDGLYLAQFVDAIAFVVRWAATEQIEAKRAIASLTAAKPPDAPILTILNQQNDARPTYERKYGGYYSYSS